MEGMGEIRKCMYVNERIQEGIERNERERRMGEVSDDGGERGEGAAAMSSRQEMEPSTYVEGLDLDDYGQLFYPGVRGEKAEYMYIDAGN